ncbi:hypothetical protein A2U01_0118682, partial [Trifolium medium]|nr:hypothetical protein [Trifolium medium]
MAGVCLPRSWGFLELKALMSALASFIIENWVLLRRRHGNGAGLGCTT